MRVFLSWSGEKGRLVAGALRDWLPDVIQAVEPWLSAMDLPAGEQWLVSITESLKQTDIGVICLTKENVNSGWLTFEAGALSKVARVCPYALDIKPSEISGPLSQFQVVTANKEGTYQLIQAINSAGRGPTLTQQALERSFEVHWPTLESHLSQIRATFDGAVSRTTQSLEEKVDELLSEIKLLKDLIKQPDTYVTSETLKELDSPPRRPRVFIGSSSEGLSVAEAIQLGLEYVAECTIWTQGTFDVSQTAIESIIDATLSFDFAIIVLTPDDLVEKRGNKGTMARDNIIFELGLFTGVLGRARTFMVYCRDHSLILPSDLSGVTAVTYAKRQDGNIEAAIGPVCTRIKKAMGVV